MLEVNGEGLFSTFPIGCRFGLSSIHLLPFGSSLQEAAFHLKKTPELVHGIVKSPAISPHLRLHLLSPESHLDCISFPPYVPVQRAELLISMATSDSDFSAILLRRQFSHTPDTSKVGSTFRGQTFKQMLVTVPLRNTFLLVVLISCNVDALRQSNLLKVHYSAWLIYNKHIKANKRLQIFSPESTQASSSREVFQHFCPPAFSAVH